MKWQILVWIFWGIAAFALAIMLFTKVVIEPWIGEKIQASVSEKSGDYLVKIEKVHVSLLKSAFELENITLISKSENEGQPELSGEIGSVKFKGIHLMKALFKKDIYIREIAISDSRLVGKHAFPKGNGPASVSPVNVRIGSLSFDDFFINLKDSATAQSYWVKDGNFKAYDINVEKQDTLSSDIFGQFDFDVPEIKIVTSDSLYTFSAVGIHYSSSSNTLIAGSFTLQPNYSEYEFTGRHTFETDRFEGRFNQLSVYDFSVEDFIKSGDLKISFIEIGEIELNVFRDKRKEFRHTEKPTFQDVIYNYPGILNIDSIGILSGNVVYSEHAEKAIKKSSISFNEIDTTIYKITNDTIYKTEKAYLKWNANALLMGKGKITFNLKARIFDSQNTFSMNGTLTGMGASDLNPILENNAFISIASGEINELNFSFSANNTKATGNLILLYQELDFAVVNKKTGETTAFAEQVISWIANMVVVESNPMPGEEVRPGMIEYERDSEKFLFSYLVKALLTGIKTSVTKM